MTWPMIAFAAAVVLMGLLPGGLLCIGWVFWRPGCSPDSGEALRREVRLCANF